MYCYSCGFKIEHAANHKPNFCAGCGSSLGKEEVKAGEALEGSDKEDESISLSGISKLDFEFIPQKRTGEKLGSIVGTRQDAPELNTEIPVDSQSSEDFRKQFEREAGALRPGGQPVDPNSGNE